MIRRLIKARDIQVRKAALKLENLRWIIGIAVLTVVLLGASFFVRNCCEWLCNVLISAGCGCVTGLVFYFLSNIRNNKVVVLQKEYDVLKSTLDILWKVKGYGSYYDSPMLRNIRKRDVTEDGCQVRILLDDLLEARRRVPREVYDVVVSLGFDPLDEDNVTAYKDSIDAANSEVEIEQCLIKIRKDLMPAIDEITLLFWERRDQLMVMGKHFF